MALDADVRSDVVRRGDLIPWHVGRDETALTYSNREALTEEYQSRLLMLRPRHRARARAESLSISGTVSSSRRDIDHRGHPGIAFVLG